MQEVVGQFGGLVDRVAHRQQVRIGIGVDQRPVIPAVALAVLAADSCCQPLLGAVRASWSARAGLVGVASRWSQEVAVT